MTKELVAQYRNICDKLEYLKANCSEIYFPRYNGEFHRLLMQKGEIESFAESLPWDKQKLVRAVMKNGTRWDVVRMEIHSYKSADAVRKEYERIFKKI